MYNARLDAKDPNRIVGRIEPAFEENQINLRVSFPGTNVIGDNMKKVPESSISEAHVMIDNPYYSSHRAELSEHLYEDDYYEYQHYEPRKYDNLLMNVIASMIFIFICCCMCGIGCIIIAIYSWWFIKRKKGPNNTNNIDNKNMVY